MLYLLFTVCPGHRHYIKSPVRTQDPVITLKTMSYGFICTDLPPYLIVMLRFILYMYNLNMTHMGHLNITCTNLVLRIHIINTCKVELR